MKKAKDDTISVLKNYLKKVSEQLELVKEKVNSPNYRWNPNDNLTDLQELVVQDTVMIRLIEERKREKITDKLFRNLLFLYRYGYQDMRNINSLVNKKPLTKKEENSLVLSYYTFKEAGEEKLLKVFLSDKQIRRLRYLTKKLEKSK